jgi:hypothetical protein
MSRHAQRTVRAAAASLLALAPRALAHHSQTEYDRSTVTELEGAIVEVIWSNPHVGLKLSVVGDDGREELWLMEAADLITTVRRGVPDHMGLVPGDRVRVAGWPSKRRSQRLIVTNVLPPSGIEILLVRGEPRWSDRTVGSDETFRDGPVVGAEPKGLFRVWTLERTVRPGFVDDPPLTAAARAALAAWSPDDDPALRCVSIGMPRAITRTGPHPIEFVERDGNIHILMEYFDLERVIHMRPDADPASAPPSALGYSVGRWDEGDLIVETTRVSWPYFDIRDLEFVPQSEEVVIVERFKLSDDEQELTLDITVTDPAAFTAPVTANDYAVWRWRPGVRVEPYNCTLER